MFNTKIDIWHTKRDGQEIMTNAIRDKKYAYINN